MALDEVDLALLERLANDGRVPFEKLGAQVGLSRTATRARVQKLLDSGTVRLEAITHPAVAGYHTFAHISVTTAGSSVHSIATQIADFPHAPFVSIVAGRCSMIAELRTRDMVEMDQAVEEVRVLPGVVALDTVLYTDVVKDSHLPLGRPHAFESFDLDEVDRHLLGMLQRDARMAYAQLAGDVGLSRAATRARVLRLLEQGVVVIKGLVNPTAVGINAMCGFQIHVSQGEQDPVAAIAKLDDVDFLARTIGRCDAIGTMIARGRAEVASTLDEMRLLEGVRAVEAWWHLELVKERYSPPVTPG